MKHVTASWIEPADKKNGFTVAELRAALKGLPEESYVRAEVGFGGMKAGGPIKKLIIEHEREVGE